MLVEMTQVALDDHDKAIEGKSVLIETAWIKMVEQIEPTADDKLSRSMLVVSRP